MLSTDIYTLSLHDALPIYQDFWKLVPEGFQSLTIYRNKAPATAWNSLGSAVSFKLDALPAVLFGSLLRSSLSVYGISDPRSEEHTSELQSLRHLVCRLLLE